MDLKFLIGSNMELIEEILPVSILYKYHSFLGWGGSQIEKYKVAKYKCKGLNEIEVKIQ